MPLLAALLAETWFALPPPKSTGRDLFDLPWLMHRLAHFGDVADVDVQATLAELTARALAESATRHANGVDEVIVCGGGANNGDLLDRIAHAFARAAGRPVRVTRCDSIEAGGIAPEHVEALAFAWLARECLAGRPGNLAAVTGARGPRILGAVYPR